MAHTSESFPLFILSFLRHRTKSLLGRSATTVVFLSLVHRHRSASAMPQNRRLARDALCLRLAFSTHRHVFTLQLLYEGLRKMTLLY